MLRLLVPIGLVLLLHAPFAVGEEPRPDPAARRAAEVVKAVEAGDAKALAALAGRSDPDPWLVADALCHDGQHDAAAAFAARAKGKDTQALPAYVASWKDANPDAAARRAALQATNAAFARRDFAAVIAAIEGAPVATDGVITVRLTGGHGLALTQLKRWADAGARYAAGAERAERMGWLRRAGDGYKQAGMLLSQAAQLERAGTMFAHDLRLQRLREDPIRIAASLGDVAVIKARTGHWAEAITILKQAEAIQREGGDDTGLPKTLMNLAICQRFSGDIRGSIATYEKALALSRRLDDHEGIIKTLVNMGGARDALGDYAAALANFDEARRRAEQRGDRFLVASCLHYMGNTHRRMGWNAEALDELTRAAAAYEALGRLDELMGARTDLGSVLARVGQVERAIELQLEVLAYLRQTKQRAKLVTHLNSIGTAYVHDGRPDEALAYLRESQQLADVLSLPMDRLRARLNIGFALLRLERHDQARARLREAHGMAVDLEKSDLAAMAEAGIGLALVEMGRCEEAVPRLTAAIDSFASRGNEEGVARYLEHRARCHYARGRHREAIDDCRRAAQVAAGLSEALSDEGGARSQELNRYHIRIGALAALELDDVAALAWFVEAGRARTLIEGLANRDAIRRVPPREATHAALTAARTAADAAVRRYAALSPRASFRDRRTARREAIDARKRLELLAMRATREAKASLDLAQPEPLPLEAIQAGLAPEEAYVALVPSTDGSVALVVRREGARAVRLGGNEGALDAACESLREALSEQQDTEAAVARVRALIAKPLALGKDVTRVLVSPQGMTSVIPYALLWPERETVRVPSASVLALLRGRDTTRGKDVLALGDPNYGRSRAEVGEAAVRAGIAGRLAPLPGTRAEVERLGNVKLLGQEATESRFRQALAARTRWRAIHLACHGLLDADRPVFTALALTAADEDDGLLTVLEMMQLDVSADLVSLSACDTGRGKVFRVEGVLGLTRAFMAAGAPRVLCSLWKVDDEATRALMVRFYELWNPAKGTPRSAAAALREAQAHVRSTQRTVIDREASRKAGRTVTKTTRPWAHPYYWAAWVLCGAPDEGG